MSLKTNDQPNNTCLGISTQELGEMVVRTISCSNNDLADFLNKNISILIMRNNFCSTNLDFINTQLESVLQAQLFVRNLVDYSVSKSSSKSLVQNRARSESESKGQQTSQGHACNFSDATGFTQFTRSSVDASRSKSTTDASAQGTSDATSTDRSTASASGYSNVWDTARATSKGEGLGEHYETSENAGKSYQRTYPGFIDYDGSDPGQMNNNAFLEIAKTVFSNMWDAFGSVKINFRAIGEAILYGVSFGELGSDESFLQFDLPAGTTFTDDLAEAIGDNISVGFNRPGPELPTAILLGCCCKQLENVDAWGDCTHLGLPDDCLYYDYPIKASYGKSYSAVYNLDISVSFLGFGFQTRLSWSDSESFQQSEVHTQACSRSVGQSETTNDYAQIDWARSKGKTETRDESQTTSDVHSYSDSQRTSTSRTDASSAATGDSEAKSETGSDRSSHAEGRNSSQGTAWSKSKSRSTGLSTFDSKSDAISENLSHISRALNEMFDLLTEEKEKIKKLLIRTQSAQIGKIENCRKQYAIPPDPVTSAMIRSLAAIWQKHEDIIQEPKCVN